MKIERVVLAIVILAEICLGIFLWVILNDLLKGSYLGRHQTTGLDTLSVGIILAVLLFVLNSNILKFIKGMKDEK